MYLLRSNPAAYSDPLVGTWALSDSLANCSLGTTCFVSLTWSSFSKRRFFDGLSDPRGTLAATLSLSGEDVTEDGILMASSSTAPVFNFFSGDFNGEVDNFLLADGEETVTEFSWFTSTEDGIVEKYCVFTVSPLRDNWSGQEVEVKNFGDGKGGIVLLYFFQNDKEEKGVLKAGSVPYNRVPVKGYFLADNVLLVQAQQQLLLPVWCECLCLDFSPRSRAPQSLNA